MTAETPDRDRRPRRALAMAALALAAFVAASLLDPFLYHTLKRPTDLRAHDWAEFLRAAGYLPTWLVLALALGVHETASRPPSRLTRAEIVRSPAFLIAIAPLLAGLGAEILKLAVRRLRPTPDHLAYAFDWPPTAHASIGTVSSHAAVAFAGALMTARLFPRTGLVLVPLAAGCAYTRLAAGAHFASDIVAAVFLAAAITGLLSRSRRADAPSHRRPE